MIVDLTNPVTSAIRDHIVAFLTDQLSLSEFQDWLVGATWNVKQHTDPDAADLAYSSKLALAELSRGDIGQTAFRERMRHLAGTTTPSR